MKAFVVPNNPSFKICQKIKAITETNGVEKFHKRNCLIIDNFFSDKFSYQFVKYISVNNCTENVVILHVKKKIYFICLTGIMV